MRALLTIALTLIITTAFSQSNLASFVLDGDISGIEGRPVTIYYRYSVEGNTIEDSVKIKNGKFSITGKISEPVIASLQVNYADPFFRANPDFNRDFLFVYLDKGNIRLTSKERFSAATIYGSRPHQELIEFNKQEQTYMISRNNLFRKLQDLISTDNKSAADTVQKAIEKLTMEMETDLYIKFIMEKPNSTIVFDVMNRLAGWKMDVDKMKPLFEQISAKQKNTWAGRDFNNRLQAAERTSIGAVAPVFQLPDTSGKMISLETYKRRFVLLDFWASWCLPCRQENPHLLQAYRNYKEKGFEIVSVSLDDTNHRDKWVKAIRQDSMSWVNISELKAFNSGIAKTYGVIAIPRNFLIDPKGTIIAADLRGKDLEEKLAELLGKRS